MKRVDIADAIEILMATPQISITDTTRSALKLYKKHPKLDYADCLLAVIGGKHGVVTFDQTLQKELLRSGSVN